VLAQGWIEIKCGSIRYIASSVVGNNGDVVADLALVWIALEGVKRIAHGNVNRPGDAGISAKGVKQL
jgi:hypothetical protein